LQASYTYSHSIDYASGDVPGNNHQDAYRWNSSVPASSNFDRRHIMILSYVYDIPYKGTGILGQGTRQLAVLGHQAPSRPGFR